MKEVCVIPGVDELIPAPCVILSNSKSGLAAIAVGEQFLDAIVDSDYYTAGTLIWETGMAPELRPESSPAHRFAGWE